MVASHRTRLSSFRRAAVTVAALAAAAGGITFAASPAEGLAVANPTMTLNFPPAVGNGGDLRAATASIDNSTGAVIPSARIDFDITPNPGTANLDASDFVIYYEAPGTTTYLPLPLTNDSSGGGVSGFYGPALGYPIATGTTTANFRVTTNPSAPTGSIKLTANLDTSPGNTASSIATATENITLSTPSLSFAGFPTSVTAGGGYTTFTGTLTNATGSNYGGSTASNTPSPAGIRLDFSLVSSNTSVTANQLSLQYCLNGTGGTACTGGTWTTIPLTETGSSTFTGFFGPTGGFALPAGATNATAFRISAATGTPASTVITHVAIDKVDSSGSTAGTDSSGVDNGTLRNVSAGVTTIKSTTSTQLTLSKTTAQEGDTVTATAAVTPTTAGGTVQFSVDGTNVGNPVTLSNTGTATATLPTTLTAGSHTVTATYSGDNNDVASSASATLTITKAPVTNPTITAHLSSAVGAHHGWYRTPVTITYTCTPGSSAIDSSGCPAPVTLTSNGGHAVTRTVTDTDGGTATSTMAVGIDHAKPHVHVKGASSGATYKHHRHLRAACSDHLSGIATCTVHSHRGAHHTVHYVATARDKAGNTAHTHGHYTIKHS